MEHFNVSSTGFYVNGEPAPRPPFKLDIEGPGLKGPGQKPVMITWVPQGHAQAHSKIHEQKLE